MKTITAPRMHVSLYVSDLEKTQAFYDQFFGESPAKVKPGYAKYVLEEPALIISFIQKEDRVKAGFGHLGFQVTSPESLRLKLGQVQAAGLKTLEEEGTNCCYALQDKFWVNDPDGHEWEVYYFHEDSEFNDPRFEGATACC